METLEIYKMLTISTAHIKGTTAEMLEGLDAPAVYNKSEYGWFIYLNYLNEDGSIPDDLAQIIQFAKDKEIMLLCLDCDAETVEELPTYEYEW